MKATSFLAVFTGLGLVTAGRKPTGRVKKSDLQAQAVISWDPPTAYESLPKRRDRWEKRCRIALAKEGCSIGTIHQGQIKMIKSDGQKSYYVNLEGTPFMNMENPKKMHVFRDGSSEPVTDWSWHDRRAMMQARRGKKKTQPVHSQEDQSLPSNAILFWDPDDAYGKRPEKRKFWEQRCGQALIRGDCFSGVIHKGETGGKKPNGEKTTYIKVEGLSSINFGQTRQMRVFKDGSSEDGWPAHERWSMKQAKRPRLNRARIQTKQAMGLGEPSTSTPAPTRDDSKHTISWDPPNVYARLPFFRKSYEEACHRALEEHGCDSAIIHKGRHQQPKPDGTETAYLNASVGKLNEPDNLKYMRLFEDGSSWLYPLGPVPRKDRRRGKGLPETQLNSMYRPLPGRPKQQRSVTGEQGAMKRPRRPSKKKGAAGTQEQGAKKRPRGNPKEQESAGPQPESQGASTTTQTPGGVYQDSATRLHPPDSTSFSGPFQAPDGFEHQHPETHAPASEHTEDVFNGRRVEGSEYQDSTA